MRRFEVGHSLELLETVEPGSVAVCVTSPPYWGKRSYHGEQAVLWNADPDCRHKWEPVRTARNAMSGGPSAKQESNKGSRAVPPDDRATYSKACALCGAWLGPYGLEPVIDCMAWAYGVQGEPCGICYLCHTREFLSRIRSALAPWGSLWWVFDDSRYGSGGAGGDYNPGGLKEGQPRYRQAPNADLNLKAADLCLIPQRVMLAALMDGWHLRADVIWAKGTSLDRRGGPMPESAGAVRPSHAFEHILVLGNGPETYYDAAGVAEPSKEDPRATAYLRDVWRLDSAGYQGAHYAVFPEALARTAIRAGSPVLLCGECRKPWDRADASSGFVPTCTCGGKALQRPETCSFCKGSGIVGDLPESGPNTAETQGEPWQENNPHALRLRRVAEECEPCEGSGAIGEWVFGEGILENWPLLPPIVLDPFAGSGTTLRVAESEGRGWIGFDISAEYAEQIRERLSQRSLSAGFLGTEKEG